MKNYNLQFSIKWIFLELMQNQISNKGWDSFPLTKVVYYRHFLNLHFDEPSESVGVRRRNYMQSALFI